MYSNDPNTIRQEKLKLLFSHTNFSLFGSVVIAVLLALALQGSLSTALILYWLVAILCLSAARYALCCLHQRQPSRFEVTTWLRLFLLGVFLSGLLWGLLGLVYKPGIDHFEWFLVLFVLTGLSGGALASLSVNNVAYLLFVIPAFSPIALNLVLSEIRYGGLMSSLILLYIFLTTLLARRSSRFSHKTIALQLEHETMARNIEQQLNTVAEQHQRILETQANLQRVNELFEGAFDTTHVMYAYLDREFNFMRVNRAYASKVGKLPEDFAGKNHFDVYPGEENKKIFEQVRDTDKSYFAEARPYQHPELGTTYWDWSLQPVHDNDGDVIGLLLSIIDVTSRQLAQLASEEKEQYIQAIMDTTVEVILTMDSHGTIEMVNPAVKATFGYERDEMIGRNIAILMPDELEDKHHAWVQEYLASDRPALSGRRIETRGRRKDGSVFPLEISVSDKYIGGRHIFTSVMRDVTEQYNILQSLKEKNTELQYLSAHDGLTGLHNRRMADEFLQREWARAVRAKQSIAVLMIDIDHFKNYNDFYGHQKGDVCLQRIAKTMQAVLNRPSDMVARYGGEEFIAILPDTDREGALQVAEKIRQSILELEIPHEATDRGYVSASIGYGVAQPVKLMNYEKLVSCADKALYQAKKQGRNCVIESDQSFT